MGKVTKSEKISLESAYNSVYRSIIPELHEEPMTEETDEKSEGDKISSAIGALNAAEKKEAQGKKLNQDEQILKSAAKKKIDDVTDDLSSTG